MSSWQEDFRNAIKTTHDLSSFLNHKISETNYPIFIPKKFAELIKNSGPKSALWRQFIPHENENDQSTGLLDPIGDQIHQKDGGIIHRYKGRLLFNPTTICPINCRYCFRKNELFENLDTFKGSIRKLEEYLENNTDVNEVILTGGDPLILSNEKLDQIFTSISKSPHVHFLRLHTRTPIILPNRIDSGFVDLMDKWKKSFKTINLVVHTNNQIEITDSFIKSIKRLNISILSQSVLMKGVNDSVEELEALFLRLVEANIRPYYLHHPDQVKGAMHFYIPLEVGRKLYGALRDNLPGWIIPHYIIDSPNGTGKNLAYNSESIEFSGQFLDRFHKTHLVSLS